MTKERTIKSGGMSVSGENAEMTEQVMQALEKGQKLLPDNMKFSETTGLTYNGKKIANSLLFVNTVKEETQIPAQSKTILVEIVAIVAPNMQMYKADIAFEALEKYDFQRDMAPRIYIEHSNWNANRVIYDLFRQQIAGIEPSKQYLLTKLGWFYIDGIRGYNAGDCIIGDMGENEVIVSSQLCEYKFQYSEPKPELRHDVIERYINQYLHLYKGKTPLVFAYLILGILRSYFAEADVAIKFCMFLLGENQSYKTTIASYGCSIFNRLDDVETHIHNLTATEGRLMEVLDHEKDMVAIIDDLNKSDSVSIERQQEGKISNLIRVAANNAGRESKRGKDEVNGQVLFCGEYSLKNMSTNNRMIVLELAQNAISKKDLTDFENASGNLGLFLKEFIEWCIDDHDAIIQEIQNEFSHFRKRRSEKDNYQERLATNYKMLEIAFVIAHDFFEAKAYKINLDIQEFAVALENAMQDQIDLLEMNGKEEEDWVMQVYRALIDVEDSYVFMKNTKEKGWSNKICYDEERDLICIPRDIITEMGKMYSNRSVKADDIIKNFQQLGLLDKDRNKQKSRTKKVLGKRAYCIKRTEWEDYVQEKYTE